MPRKKQDEKLTKRAEMLRHLAAGWSGSTWNAFGTPRAAEALEALRRLDSGTYGICADCGGRIPEARLQVKPEAIRCVKCQTAREGRSVA